MKNVTYYSASAGSGKTFQLTHKLAELTANGINPSEVILTTFTKSAAADFKERARKVLYEERQYDKAALLDQATIGTIHSVAENFIHRYWYLLGLTPQMNVMDEESVDFYTSQSLATLPTDEDLKLFRNFRHIFDLTHRESGRNGQPYTYFWKDWLKDIIDKKTSYGIDDLKESADYSLNQLKKIFKPSKKKFDLTPDRCYLDTLEHIKEVASTETSGEAQKRLASAKSLLSKHSWTIKDFSELLSLLGKCTKAYNLTEKDAMMAELSEMWHSTTVYGLISTVVNRLFQLAERWADEYAQYKRDHHILDFNDMERYLLQLLTDDRVKDVVRSEICGRYKVLMVDEYQDCNPIQVKIFNQLSELVEQSYWCGDSKQAIYGFRGTDTQLTEAVVDAIPEDNITTLDTSYRSEPVLVEFCNSVFTRMFKDKLPEKKIRLTPAKEKGTETNLIHWHSPCTNKEDFIQSVAEQIRDFVERNHLTYKDMAVLARSNADLDKLAQHLQGLHVPVNRGTGSLLLQKETELVVSVLTLITDSRNLLAKAKIAYLTRWDGPWCHRLPIEELIDDRLEYIDHLKEDEEDLWMNDYCFISDILQQREQWRNQNVSSLIETVIVELEIRAIIRKWGNGESRERNLTQLISLARTYEQYCDTMMLGATTTGFIDYLRQRENKSAGNEQGVTLTTYHKSKGLEWKNVILLSLNDDAMNEQKLMSKSVWGVQYVRSAPPTKDNLFPKTFVSLLPWLWGENGNLPQELADAVHSLDIYQETRQAVLDESARLLYVGMTRACQRIITTSYQKSHPFKWLETLGITSNSIPGEGSIDLFDTGYPSIIEKLIHTETDEDEMMMVKDEVKDSEEDVADEVKDEEDEIEVDMKRDTEEGATDDADEDYDEDFEEMVYALSDGLGEYCSEKGHAPKYISPSHPLSSDKAEIGAPIEISKRFSVKGKPEMNKVGDCIHNIYAAYRGETETDQTMAQALVDSFDYTEVLPDVEAIIETRTLLEKYLIKTFGKKTNEYHELPFQYKTDDLIAPQIVRGSMDLVWETSGGCVLIDFKTFPGSVDSITNPDNPHYAGLYGPQFTCYRDALVKSGKKVLQCYVFYPVVGLLVPIEVDSTRR